MTLKPGVMMLKTVMLMCYNISQYYNFYCTSSNKCSLGKHKILLLKYIHIVYIIYCICMCCLVHLFQRGSQASVSFTSISFKINFNIDSNIPCP